MTKFKVGDAVVVLETEVFAKIVEITENGYVLKNVYGKVIEGTFQDDELDLD